jgi:large subunit ribosomal protein L24
MKLKKGDQIIVISGSDKGSKGKISRVFPSAGKILVEGVNVKKRHQRPTRSGQKGTTVEKEMPFDASNAMLLDPSLGVPTRVGKKLVGGKMLRYAKKSGSVIDK